MTREEKVRAKYNIYLDECKDTGQSPESFHWWCFLTASREDLEPALKVAKTRNEQIREQDTVLLNPGKKIWDPNDKIFKYKGEGSVHAKINTEYVKAGKALKEHQKKENEKDIAWYEHDQAQKDVEFFQSYGRREKEKLDRLEKPKKKKKKKSLIKKLKDGVSIFKRPLYTKQQWKLEKKLKKEAEE